MAAEHIRLGMRIPCNKVTFNAYVNDAIGYRMTPEQVLYYSPNVYGTADAIRFYENSRFLRIHDLKTGNTRSARRSSRSMRPSSAWSTTSVLEIFRQSCGSTRTTRRDDRRAGY